jgi:hypothetical protein
MFFVKQKPYRFLNKRGGYSNEISILEKTSTGV